jgi:hypothetical protein
MNSRLITATVAVAALAVPGVAVAKPDPGKRHDKPATHVRGEGKKVTFIFKGTFSAPGTVNVLSGNAHVRKGGFVGQAVSASSSTRPTPPSRTAPAHTPPARRTRASHASRPNRRDRLHPLLRASRSRARRRSDERGPPDPLDQQLGVMSRHARGQRQADSRANRSHPPTRRRRPAPFLRAGRARQRVSAPPRSVITCQSPRQPAARNHG